MSTSGGNSAGSLSVLRSIRSRPLPDPNVERCDMCAEPIAGTHQHIVDLQSRALMCACRGCYLLFTASDAHLRYRAVPDRFLSFPTMTFDAARWDALQIPVGLAFFFFSSVLGKTVAFYPGPAGVTESELPLDAWDSLRSANPQLELLEPDVEAVLVRAAGQDQAEPRGFLVPIDSCYELAGRLRTVWRGFDGGQDAKRAIADFFDRVDKRCRPAPEPPGRDGPR
ncbi:MAG: DUF5947 family protein [Nocardioidaceae bacterium]